MLNVNEYFAGKVKSIGFDSGSIGRQSIGVMDAGEYTFSTDKPEEMTVITGAPDWQVFSSGETFFVPGHSEFNLQVAEPTSYLCKYLS